MRARFAFLIDVRDELCFRGENNLCVIEEVDLSSRGTFVTTPKHLIRSTNLNGAVTEAKDDCMFGPQPLLDIGHIAAQSAANCPAGGSLFFLEIVLSTLEVFNQVVLVWGLYLQLPEPLNAHYLEVL